MAQQDIVAFLEKNYPNEKIKYLGQGSDSDAFRVGTRVFRFTSKNISIYAKDADICHFVQPYVDVQVPDIQIVHRDGFQYAVHEMLMGDSWSWHKFQFSPARQRNLARSAAQFLAQLHSIDTDALVRAVPALRQGVPYIDFDVVVAHLRPFMTARQLRRFREMYNRVVNAPVAKSDMVLVHMGLKGANSVVYPDGRLKGVFDFCNCGIYERGRDLVLFSLSRNKRLYNQFLREYQKLTGVRVSRKHIRELALIEFLWAKRWYIGDVFAPMGANIVARNVGQVLMYFYHLPEITKPLVRVFMKIHARMVRK